MFKTNHAGRRTYNSGNFITGFNRKFRLKSRARLIAVVLVMLLCVAALFVLLGGSFNPVEAVMSAIAPTPSPSPIPSPTPIPATPTPTPTLKPTPTPVPPGKAVNDVIVVIDPGHGGRDPGTTSPYEEGFYEKEVTLDMSIRLREKMEKAGIKVVMTRETDKELHSYWKEDVWARPRIANEVNATFFVSIHVNAFDTDQKNYAVYNGTEIYHQGKTHGEFTSKKFAQIMGEEVDAVTDTKYNGVVKDDLGVLRLSNMPALLVETAYITNREDHERLKSDEFREAMTDGILNGTIRILETLGAYKEDGVYKILTDQ